MCDQYEPENLPDQWFCEINPGERNSCDKPEGGAHGQGRGLRGVLRHLSSTGRAAAGGRRIRRGGCCPGAGAGLRRGHGGVHTLSKEQPAAAEEEPAAAEGGGDAVPECVSDPDVCGLCGCTLSRLHKGLCNIGGNLDGRKRTASAARS